MDVVLWAGRPPADGDWEPLLAPFLRALSTPAWDDLPAPAGPIHALVAELTTRWPADTDSEGVWSTPPLEEARGPFLRLSLTTAADEAFLLALDEAIRRNGLVPVTLDGMPFGDGTAADVRPTTAPDPGAGESGDSPFPPEWVDDPLPADAVPDRVVRVDGPRAEIGGLAHRPRWLRRRR